MRANTRIIITTLLVFAALCLAACSGGSVSASSVSSGASGGVETSASTLAASAEPISADAAPSAEGKHLIGVAVYSTTDDEVQMFKDYLVNYIAGVCFDDVQFMYSGDITSEEQLISFIDDVAAAGGEGLMSFYNIDLAAEVERCAEHGMYHIVASGTVSDEDFAKVEDNDHFLGVIGPGLDMEYTAGGNMARNYVAKKAGNRYFIMSGGAALGNAMHYQRTLGILDALETGYGVDLGKTEDLAAVPEPMTIEAEDLLVTIAPGYISREEMRQSVIDAFEAGEYDVVLASLAAEPVLPALEASNVEIAMVDCYSQDNQLLFESGKLNYLAGKYGSLVGPSFAAMYNAVTGYAADFRDGGKAFKVVQNFWSSESVQDFNEKYEFASNATTPAFNYEDLYGVCRAYTPEATLEDFVNLAKQASFDDAKARRTRS